MKLSVSIVTYEQEGFIRQTLQSVLDQETDFDFEVIVGDDASTDQTPEILLEMAKDAPHPVRLLLADKNYGDSGLSNFMATVDASTGEYVAFLDGDDYWHMPHKLQRQVDFLDRHPECAICVHRCEHLLANGDTILTPRPNRGDAVLPVDKLIVSNFAEKISTVVRRSALETLPDWYRTTSAISADWLFNVLIAREGKIGYIDDVMAVHRLHSDSLSIRHGTQKLMADKLKSLELLKPYLPQSARAIARAERRVKLKMRLLSASPRTYTAMKRLNKL